MSEFATRGRFLEIENGNAVSFSGHWLPEYFRAFFYVIESNGKPVTQTNYKEFKTWRIELLIKISKSDWAEVVSVSVQGAKAYKGHTRVLFGKAENDTQSFGTLQARHFEFLHKYRATLISSAITQALQYWDYEASSGTWFISDRSTIKESELVRIGKEVRDRSYKRLDGSFYQEFAERYKELVRGGDKTPIRSLRLLFYPDKSAKQVQAYATEARKLKLIAETSTGKNSTVRNQTKRKRGK